MREGRIKVLMLGWEFPPLMAGGLGMACYGLAKALSNYVDLTLIIPRAEENPGVDTFLVKGLNRVTDKEVPPATGFKYVDIKGKTFLVEHPGLDPYPYSHFQKEFYDEIIERYGSSVPPDTESIRKLFDDKVAYGPNIMQKVAVYADTVSKMVKNLDFDIIHAHDWITYTAAIRIRNESGKPLAIHVHSLETDRVGVHAKYQEWNEVYRIERMGIQAADKILPVSHYTADCAVAHYGANPEKIRPIYNSIDPLDETPEIPVGETDGKKEKVVVWVGRITHQKGPEFLLGTAEILIKHLPEVKFAIAGTGDMMDDLKRRVWEKGLQEKIVFLGFVSKKAVNDLLSRADAYFMPSVSEPFGLSALEAGQIGVPCVLSKQSGAAEVMNFSLTADHWDVVQMANYLYASIQYDALAKLLVTETSQQIEQMSWDDPAKEVVSVYQQMLQNHYF